ncbi:MAG: hypothetical protein ACPGUV_06590 [Polyangiales bacterium]
MDGKGDETLLQAGPGAVLDRLIELEHDLGKYLRWPLAMLPADASDAEWRQALFTALEHTRRGPDGVQGAAEVWADFIVELGPTDDRHFQTLAAAVERALGWRQQLEPGAPRPDRARVKADFDAVAQCLARWIEALQ